MGLSRIRPPGVAAAALASAAALAACGGSGATASTPAMTSAMPAQTSTAKAAPVATDHVAITGFAFGPGTITVRPGTAVTWTQRDEDQHTVTADDGSFTSSPLVTGTSYTHILTAPGTHPYHCSIHPFMHGTVVVAGG